MSTDVTVVSNVDDESNEGEETAATATAVEAAVTSAVAATVAAQHADDVVEAEQNAEGAAAVSTMNADDAARSAERAEVAASEAKYSLASLHAAIDELPSRIAAAMNPPVEEVSTEEIEAIPEEAAPVTGNWLTRKWFGQ